MGELTDEQIDAAAERGRIVRQNEPRAAAVRYDPSLTKGCSFAFPPHLVQGLEGASDEQLSKAEILGAGYGLHWEELDVDVSVPGLLAGVFGTSAYIAGQAGRSKSPAKASAARSNGVKGGRPRKSVA